MSNTPANAGSDQRAMVSDALLQKALAGRSAEEITALLGATAVSAIVAAQTPPAAPAASEEDAGDKPKKMKGKGKKDKMESEDAEYDDEDEMEASTAPLSTAAEIGNAFMAVFPDATASQVLACIAITDRAKAAAPAPSSNQPEEGAAELAALIKHNASNLDAGGGEAPKAKNHGWDEIHAEVQKLRGH